MILFLPQLNFKTEKINIFSCSMNNFEHKSRILAGMIFEVICNQVFFYMDFILSYKQLLSQIGNWGQNDKNNSDKHFDCIGF